MSQYKPQNIDEYISVFPEEPQRLLNQIRSTITKLVPEAVEVISYGIPCLRLNGYALIYFAGYKAHIGMYPVPTRNEELNKEFKLYKTSGKGTIQFPLDKPLPFDLITKIVNHLLKENLDRVKSKKKNIRVK